VKQIILKIANLLDFQFANASFRLNLFPTLLLPSLRALALAAFFSSLFRNQAFCGLPGSQKKATTPVRTVNPPSMINSHIQPLIAESRIWKTP
jgi:hypothetical protein